VAIHGNVITSPSRTTPRRRSSAVAPTAMRTPISRFPPGRLDYLLASGGSRHRAHGVLVAGLQASRVDPTMALRAE
jgi:hypothetical protein